MNVMIVVCNSHEESFNHAIADRVKNVYEREANHIFYHDLYKEGFDGVLPQNEIDARTTDGLDEYVVKTCDELLASDIVVVIHPNWWGMPPGLLKGWIDRIFRRGVAYRFDPFGRSIGLLTGKKGIVFNTSNTPEETEMKLYGDPLENLWKNCVFGMCGITDFKRKNFYGVVRSTEKERAVWLNQVQDLITEEGEI